MRGPDGKFVSTGGRLQARALSSLQPSSMSVTVQAPTLGPHCAFAHKRLDKAQAPEKEQVAFGA